MKSDYHRLLRNFVFGSEKISQRPRKSAGKLPGPIKKARDLEKGANWNSRNDIFIEQGRILADYEDNHEYSTPQFRYYPTYQSLDNDELRGYFTWRAQWRKNAICEPNLTYIYLLAYEIINNIGIATSLDGHEQLKRLREEFGREDARLNMLLGRWLNDYVIYYNLPKELLTLRWRPERDSKLEVLENIRTETPEKIIEAVNTLAPKWLKRSRFYADNSADMDQVIVRVLKRMDAHYAKGCKKNLVEQFFGIMTEEYYSMFSSAIFCDPLNRDGYSYEVNPQLAYNCSEGFWTISRRYLSAGNSSKFEGVLKGIDCLMRKKLNYGHPIKSDIRFRWLQKAIEEEIDGLVAEKQRAKKTKLEIDFSSLGQIRADAIETQEKLAIEEEAESRAVAVAQERVPVAAQEPGLEPAERRLLHDLLYGGDTGWLREEGAILSVLIDSINNKLYDTFEDNVLDDAGAVEPDYMDELKEMIPQ